jgi:cytidylate kinase
MENRLFEYMNKRIGGSIVQAGTGVEAGPVITISRQTGCGASRIAYDLCEALNKKKAVVEEGKKWGFISREILQQSAEQLHLDPLALKHVINDKDRGIMDQIVEALSTHSHKSDQKILKTVQEVIWQFGNNGNVVIIGRGGAAICKDIKHSLHIRIEAPEDWRISEIAKRFDYSIAYSTDYVRKQDGERELLVKKLFGKNPINSIYDVEFNRSRFTENEIVEAILQISTIKGLIK